jgi:ethanolamine utilization microcompartment shell protein EutL
MTLVNLRDLLISTGIPIHHYEAHKATGNYIVWAEDGQAGAGHGDNHMKTQIIGGTIDYFTKTEFDPAFDTIQAKLNSADLAWKLNSIQYEKETGYIHYEWVFGVVSTVG